MLVTFYKMEFLNTALILLFNTTVQGLHKLQ